MFLTACRQVAEELRGLNAAKDRLAEVGRVDGAPNYAVGSVTSVANPCLQVETSITFAIFAIQIDEETDQLVAEIQYPARVLRH